MSCKIKQLCTKCNKNITKNNFTRHFSSCREKVKKVRGIDFDPNIGFKKGTRQIWNKGLTKETDKRVKKYGIASSLTQKGRPGKKLTEETKLKISNSLKKYLLENPDKVPYKQNHYSKGPSYPESYFKGIFENFSLITYYRIGIYELDFANIEKKICIEIDGEQHYLDKRIGESDNRKDQYLISNGWKVLRIRWADWQKKSKEEKSNLIDTFRKLLMGL